MANVDTITRLARTANTLSDEEFERLGAQLNALFQQQWASRVIDDVKDYEVAGALKNWAWRFGRKQ